MTQPTEAESKFIDKLDNPMINDQQAAIADASAGGSGATAGAYASAALRDETIAAVNLILAAMRKHGLIAD